MPGARSARDSAATGAAGVPDDTAGASPGRAGQVLRGSAWYTVAVAMTAVGGFIFWWLAARIAPPDTVGQASALFTSVMFLGFVTSMGLPVAVARYTASDDGRALFGWALVYTTAASLVGTVAYLLIVPHFLSDQMIGSLWTHGWGAAAAATFLLVNGVGFTVLVEMRLVTLRAWGWLVGRVVLINVIRLALLVVTPLGHSVLGLLFLMAGTNALSGLIGAFAIQHATRTTGSRLFPLPSELIEAWRYASVNYVGMLAAQAPQFTMPLVIAHIVAPAENAAFFLAWNITTVIFIVPHTISQVVLAEGSRDVRRMNHQLKVGLMLALAAMTTMALGAAAFSGLATKIFGPEYALTGTLLPVLVAAGIPWAFTAIFLARSRLLHQSSLTLSITTSFAVLTMVPMTMLAQRSGVQAASWGWLVGNVAAAAAAAVLTLRSRRDVELARFDAELDLALMDDAGVEVEG